ncbi:MAG TPA: response regulator [Chloroflexota bacterium]|jgi:DNA-binding response OmpR family regulator|nr:response regulator [Chloroflexota bacterium]
MAYEILVVDDDADMLRMLSLVLNEEGYQVRLARDGDEAIRAAEEQAPDLVLLDLLLPVEPGLTVAERLKSGVCSDVPIIAMSASDPMIARVRAEACFEGWLPKPFSFQTLLHYVSMAGDA